MPIFTLKDEKSVIPAVMFSRVCRNLKFEPKKGMKVLIKGSVNVYKQRGAYQLYVNRITEDGLGDLHIAFEQLKEKLEKEGLFSLDHKKELPHFPKRVGVITASTGAAVRDILTTIESKWPVCEVIVLNSYVQGDKAPSNLIQQIRNAQNFDLDVLILARGGGSIEDLWAFNTENVAREIYNCPIPVISAVGHETDVTISDFVADKRSLTPTAGARDAVPDIDVIRAKLADLKSRLNSSVGQKITVCEDDFNNLLMSKCFTDSAIVYKSKEDELVRIKKDLNYLAADFYKTHQNDFDKVVNSLKYNNPVFIVKNNKREFDILKNSLISIDFVSSAQLDLDNIKKDLLYLANTFLNDDLAKFNSLVLSLKHNNPQKTVDYKSIKVSALKKELINNYSSLITSNQTKLNDLTSSLKYNSPQKLIDNNYAKLNELKLRLSNIEDEFTYKKEQELEKSKSNKIIILLAAIVVIFFLIILFLLIFR